MPSDKMDAARQQLILLTTRMETWTLHGEKWIKLSPVNSPQPVPNGFFAIGYDPVQKVSLFFGGESRLTKEGKRWIYPEATWVFDGRSWTKQ